jgi:hypothetical protein
MKKISLLILLVLLSTLLTGCKKSADSHWLQERIDIDGAGTDWQRIPLNNFQKPNVTLGLSNDENNLYVMLAFKDLSLIRMFSMNGITIWMDYDGKKNRNLGIKYIPPFVPDALVNERMGNRIPPEQMRRMEIMQRNRKSGITIIKDGVTLNSIAGNMPIAAMQSNLGTYNLELKIPLQNFGGQSVKFTENTVSKIMVGFEIKPPDRNSNMEVDDLSDRIGMGMGEGRQNMGNRGNRGQGNQGGRGGRGDMQGQNRTMMLSKKELWVSVNLANKN